MTPRGDLLFGMFWFQAGGSLLRSGRYRYTSLQNAFDCIYPPIETGLFFNRIQTNLTKLRCNYKDHYGLIHFPKETPKSIKMFRTRKVAPDSNVRLMRKMHIKVGLCSIRASVNFQKNPVSEAFH